MLITTINKYTNGKLIGDIREMMALLVLRRTIKKSLPYNVRPATMLEDGMGIDIVVEDQYGKPVHAFQIKGKNNNSNFSDRIGCDSTTIRVLKKDNEFYMKISKPLPKFLDETIWMDSQINIMKWL